MNPEIINRCRELLGNADAVLIGAGAGLSTAAGLEYSGKRFTNNFPDFIKRYGLTDMYSSMFYPFPSQEERWAYISRHIRMNSYAFAADAVYTGLLELVQDKKYFVITTNGDGLFFKAGFAADKIFATQGDYTKFQCAKPCHGKLYDNEKMVREMVQQQTDCRIPSDLIPQCPVCGGGMVPYLRVDESFIENDDWKKAGQRYQDFFRQTETKKLVLLELGVGFNTPSIIRWPFEKIASAKESSTLIRVNRDDTESSLIIPEKSVLIKGDIACFIQGLLAPA